jgi:hypothetical protein
MKELTDFEVKRTIAQFTRMLAIEMNSNMFFHTPIPLAPSALNLIEWNDSMLILDFISIRFDTIAKIGATGTA